MSQRAARVLCAFAVTALFAACNEQTSNLYEGETDGIRIYLNEQNTLYVAVPSGTDLPSHLCRTNGAATSLCEQNSSDRTDLDAVGEKDGRKFFKGKAAVTPDAQSVFKIVATSATGSTPLFSFRFKDSAADADPVNGTIEQALASVSETALRSEINYIAGDAFNGRLSGSADHVNASNWVIGELKKIGLPAAQNDDYLQKFQFSANNIGSVSTHNIVAMLEGSDPALKSNYIVIGAHLDHAGTLSRGYTCSSGQSGNSICNGADDNASGSVTLLNIARAVVKTRALMKRSVIFIWFSGEEEGLKGSNHFVKNPVVPLDKIDYMINLDMVGYLRQYGNRIDAIGASSSKYAYEQIKAIAAKYPAVKLKYDVQAQGGSDHEPFMTKGIPAIFFHTGVSSNPNYHKTSDTPDKIDTNGMQIIAKMAIEQLIAVGNKPAGLTLTEGERKPLLPPWEIGKSCHHLIVPADPDQLDFRYGPTGKPAPGEYTTD
jgi:hypothetical protein